MTYAPIEAVAKSFLQQAVCFRAVCKIMGVMVYDLRMGAFSSASTDPALANCIAEIEEKCKKVVKLCDDYSGALVGAMSDHKSGDYKAGTYFGDDAD